jgi:redox-regulated HSP33 family molecular chaperone
VTTAVARSKRTQSQRAVSRLTVTRLGYNEALARRSGNDGEGRRPSERLPFQCECEGERCHEALVLTRREYEHVRAQQDWLIVAPGHQVRNTRVQARLHGCFVLERET